MGELLTLPKAHLHVHLEGSIRARTLSEIAYRHRLKLPECAGQGYHFRDFADFNLQYRAIRSCLQEAQDFRRVAFELCEDEAAQGVHYAEVTFTLGAHGPRLGNWEMPLESVLEGFAQGEQAFGIKCRVIVDHGRSKPSELARQALRAALRYRDRGVVGFGLGGDEKHPPEQFAEVFYAAVDGGLHSVPHAGETTGPESIRGAIHALRAERIGHGISVLDDEMLVDELKARDIALEVCLTSNVAIPARVPSIDCHPLPHLMAAGLTVTINADTPAIFAAPIASEYQLARDTFGLDDAALAGLAHASVTASFADADTKTSLRHAIDRWLCAARDSGR
jgi:adenosine deaminase